MQAASKLIHDASKSKYARDMQKFTNNESKLQRARIVAVVINKCIDQFDGGDNDEGIQAFQHAIRLRIRIAKLSEKKWFLVKKVGVHPDNREGVGLVPIDVHDLLSQIVKDGWNYELVDALAGEVPPDHIFFEENDGRQVQVANWFRDFNKRLVEEAGGLLPQIDLEEMDIVTARGSHTTSSVRCMDSDEPVVGVHENTMNSGTSVERKLSIRSQRCNNRSNMASNTR